MSDSSRVLAKTGFLFYCSECDREQSVEHTYEWPKDHMQRLDNGALVRLCRQSETWNQIASLSNAIRGVALESKLDPRYKSMVINSVASEFEPEAE